MHNLDRTSSPLEVVTYFIKTNFCEYLFLAIVYFYSIALFEDTVSFGYRIHSLDLLHCIRSEASFEGAVSIEPCHFTFDY